MNVADERYLLLFGLLSTQRQHGYQINEFIERNLGRVSNMKKATAYSLLNRLAKDGLVDVSIEQDGNRPVRRVYGITPDGARLFSSMLRDILAEPVQNEPHGDIALMFIDHLDRDIALEVISQRIARLDAEIDTLTASPPHGVGLGVDLAISRRLALVQADREWFSSARERIRRHLPETSEF